MEVQDERVFKPFTAVELSKLNRKQLIIYGEIIERWHKKVETLMAKYSEEILHQDNQILLLKKYIYGKSSERTAKSAQNSTKPDSTDELKSRPKRQTLSERYPDIPLKETIVSLQSPPQCDCCDAEMEEMGITEDSEALSVEPKVYSIELIRRSKYRCKKCHGAIVTTPAPNRIKPKSQFSDSLIIDAIATKYDELTPIERTARIAEQSALPDLPPNSLILATHYGADFFLPVCEAIEVETLTSKVLNADETPWNMLEGDKKRNWRLWSFSNQKAVFYDIRDTRSGDVSTEYLEKSSCEFVMSDKYSGYAKSTRESNESRTEMGRPLIQNIYCNAHSRRYFKDANHVETNDTQAIVEAYDEIYKIEKECKDLDQSDEIARQEILKIRAQMTSKFEWIKREAEALVQEHSNKSETTKACKYFLSIYTGLTRFITDPDLPIDNNSQERLMRSAVVGRKTWYGNHSKRGAITTARLFTIAESCKLNHISLREFLKEMAVRIHKKHPILTPYQYKLSKPQNVKK